MDREGVFECQGRLAPGEGAGGWGGDAFPKLGNIGAHPAFSTSQANAVAA